MLPNRFSLLRQTEEKLKREKQRTGVSPNILARELFFKSVERGKINDTDQDFKAGQMALEKSVWLGDLENITEQIIKNLYGEIEKEEAAKKWALHVQHAAS
nr:DNA sulfur modification protein DndE [Virgibacillus halodenitrificans]